MKINKVSFDTFIMNFQFSTYPRLSTTSILIFYMSVEILIKTLYKIDRVQLKHSLYLASKIEKAAISF